MAGVVATVDEEAAVVPRGAYVRGPLGDVVINKSFKGIASIYGRGQLGLYYVWRDLFKPPSFLGLCLGDAKRLNYYYHFQLPKVDAEEKEVSQNVRIVKV